MQTYCGERVCTVDDPRAPTPAAFRGELYPPQAALLAALLAAEASGAAQPAPARGVLHAAPGVVHADGASQKTMPRAGLIAERFSFGKTTLLLAAAAASQEPGAAAARTVVPLAGAVEATAARQAPSRQSLPRIEYLAQEIHETTVVYASVNVIAQWEGGANQFTPTLTKFTVDSARALEALKKRQGPLPALIFVRAGRISKTINGKKTDHSILSLLAETLDAPVRRLVIDDYDTLPLKRDDRAIRAAHTWFCSATQRAPKRATACTPPVYASAVEALRAWSWPSLERATEDWQLTGALRLRCDPVWVDTHINSTALTHRVVWLRGGGVARALRGIATAEVVEMVSADAVGAAARSLGLEAATAPALLRRVLDRSLAQRAGAARALARLAATARAAAAPAAVAAAADAVDSALHAEDPAEYSALVASGSLTGAAIAAATARAEAAAAAAARDLSRVRDNINEGCCQSCHVELRRGGGAAPVAVDPSWGAAALAAAAALAEEAPPAVYILGCCQLIVCEECIANPLSAAGNLRQFIQRCPNCMARLKLSDLVRVGAELDLEAAFGEPGDGLAADGAGEGPAADGAAAGAAGAAGADDAETVPRLAALRWLLATRLGRGNEPRPAAVAYESSAPLDLPGLLTGRRNVPRPAGAAAAVLIFAAHRETAQVLAAALQRWGVPWRRLMGGRAEREAAVAAVKTGAAAVLVATTPADCAGIDAPWLTDVYFYHRVIDAAVAAQVVARAQRLGRETNLEVTSLLCAGE